MTDLTILTFDDLSSNRYNLELVFRHGEKIQAHFFDDEQRERFASSLLLLRNMRMKELKNECDNLILLRNTVVREHLTLLGY
jgi:hypothetical protein